MRIPCHRGTSYRSGSLSVRVLAIGLPCHGGRDETRRFRSTHLGGFMRVVVVGANGQVGRAVVQAFTEHDDEVCGLTHAEIEIVSMESVKTCLATLQPDVVVNTAAMHHVENCEAQPDKAYAANGLGARNLALVTRN